MVGKRVGVVGQGATGIQIAQESARDASELTVFIRTPNSAIPMNQRPIDQEQAKKDLEGYVPRKLLKERYRNISGFLYDDPTKKVFDDTPEEREKVWDAAYNRGGFELIFTYADILIDEKANRAMYDYLMRKTRARITDPRKRDILAPLEPPHSFAGKRPSLEQDYYEQLDKPHVNVVSLKEVSVTKVVPEGVVTSDGKLHELDILAIATGFDSLTGSFTQLKIKGIDGQDLKQKWSTDQGALSWLGLAVAEFPNVSKPTFRSHAVTSQNVLGTTGFFPSFEFFTLT
jgi:cation diffusion facilitator CzcD-associated flavoprotein CzcO